MRAVAAALMVGLVACSSGGASESGQPAAIKPTTTTAVDPEAAFTRLLGQRLSGQSADFRTAAVDLARSMCRSLDVAAANAEPATAEDLNMMALDAASGTGLDPAVTATVMNTGAEVFCPVHAAKVRVYTATMG